MPDQLMRGCTRKPLDKKCETGVFKNGQMAVATDLAQNTSASISVKWFGAVADVSCVCTQHIRVRSMSQQLYSHEFNRKSSGCSSSARPAGSLSLRGRDRRRTSTSDVDAAAMASRTSLCVSSEVPMPAA